MDSRHITIRLTLAEIQSGLDRQAAAEGLIKQLSKDHDGRNTWLLNYGQGEEAKVLRATRGVAFDWNVRAADTTLSSTGIHRHHVGDSVEIKSGDLSAEALQLAKDFSTALPLTHMPKMSSALARELGTFILNHIGE